MNRGELQAILYAELGKIAPEADPAALDADADLREALELDSMDFMLLIIALSKRLQISIPDRDHHRLNSLNHLLRYLEEKRPG